MLRIYISVKNWSTVINHSPAGGVLSLQLLRKKIKIMKTLSSDSINIIFVDCSACRDQLEI